MTGTGPSGDPAHAARTVFIGSGGFGVPALRALAIDPSIVVVGVVTAPARPAGRRLSLVGTPIADVAAELGLGPILTPSTLRDPASIAGVLALDPALIVLADYGQIVPAALLGLPHGALNLHPSLLPRHRGATPVPAAILTGDTTTGVTLMRMDAGLDTGPIVAQAEAPVGLDETAPALEARLAAIAAELLAASLSPWLAGTLAERPQTAAEATLTTPLHRADGRLDPARPAIELERQVRAYQPWPGSFVDTVGGRLTIWRAEAGRIADGRAGEFGARGLSTVDGTLVFHDVQPAGGRRMPWVEYLRGRPGITGSAALASDRDA